MKNIATKLITVLLLAFTLFSCSKEEKTISQKLVRIWHSSAQIIGEEVIPTSDTTQYLEFTNKESFNRYVNGELQTGRYELDSNIITLFSTYKEISSPIDSIVHQYNDEGKPELEMYNNNQLVTIFKDNELPVKEASIQFRIDNISDKDLVLVNVDNPVSSYVYQYKPKVLASSISFYSVSRGLLGLLALIFIAYLFSANRKAISWSLVIKGLSAQILLAIGVLYVPFIANFFDALGSGFVNLIDFTNDGIDFVFGQFGAGENGKSELQPALISFAFKILPTIIFFSALMSIFYYLGILQKIVYAFAWLMKKTLKLSGAESLAAAGNIFMGQTESPLLVKPYLDKMTKSELMCLMTGGMATIAGGVLAAYIGFLGGDDPAEQALFAKHLLTASIMSAPAAVVAAKILVPETEKFNEDMTIPKDKIGTNILEAISNGTTDGLKLAINVGAMLLVFTALIYMLNGGLNWVGDWSGLNDWIASNTAYDKFSFQFLLGYAFAPISWLMGVDNWNDMLLTGQLLGEKTILNEFYAYKTLGEMKAAGSFVSDKAIVMSTYMLCGFANFASIGIQIGGIGALAPTRKGLLSKLGVKALIGGTLACLFTAVVVGMLM